MMFKPEVEANDINDIEVLVAELFIKHPDNPDGSKKQQIAFSAYESKMLVATVLTQLGRRGYAVMKPRPMEE